LSTPSIGAVLIGAVTRLDISHYVSTLIWIYTILILIRILLSWVPNMPYNPVLNVIVRFITDVTEPYLAIWRRIVPMVNIQGAGLDISPILAIFVLTIGGELIVKLIAG
jgi:YggT family protein